MQGSESLYTLVNIRSESLRLPQFWRMVNNLEILVNINELIIKSIMKLKIHKVVAVNQKEVFPQDDVFDVNGIKYYVSPTKLQDNFTGFPINLYLICTLPQNQYEYLKMDIRAENIDFRQIINKKSETFKEVRKSNCRRTLIFTYTPPYKGNYRIMIQAYYKLKNIFQPNQPIQQKKQVIQFGVKTQQPFQVTQKIVSEDKIGSISFPLFIHYTIENKLPDRQLQFSASFQSDKFNFNFLNSENIFKLNIGQVYYLMVELEPQSVKQLLNQKGITLGSIKLQYGNQAKFIKKTSLKDTDKYILFKAQTITKTIPKKDIAIIQIKFSKIYNVLFEGLTEMRVIIDEKQLAGVKIIKTSQQIINLDKAMSVMIDISVICMKSGHFHLKGLSLQTLDGRIINYCNQLTFFVQNQQTQKAEPAFEKTTVIDIDNLI